MIGRGREPTPTILACAAAIGFAVLGNAVDSDIDPHGINRPASPVIAAMVWAPTNQIIRAAQDGDNWSVTRADDGDITRPGATERASSPRWSKN